jgi:hypothetical protein
MDLLCDNLSAIDQEENYRISELSKHMSICDYRVRELIYDKTLPLMYILAKYKLVNMCTVDLSEVQLSKLHAIALGFNEGGC